MYLPIAILAGFATALVVLMIAVNLVLGPKRYNRAKFDQYECGIDPTPMPAGGGKFPIKYYVIAMLFIIFDIEIVFLYPWAVAFQQLGTFAFIEMILFMITAFIAYVYVWRRGGLEWE